ncbi:PRKR-interacting protein 1 isoform X1 [Varanus komodoensis]|uniref:PRKR-interacting protein 1 isoform X1 n=1 Tax=Varanus komodoensis TaxID=61221 RepID=UPI001CF7D1D3|nr:PRKR-interacting protein 1 isoform X1 [Varanus komodoensis]
MGWPRGAGALSASSGRGAPGAEAAPHSWAFGVSAAPSIAMARKGERRQTRGHRIRRFQFPKSSTNGHPALLQNSSEMLWEKMKENMVHCICYAPPKQGSSAGAGSGEFHVYRHLRRREYQRQDFMDAMAEKQKLDEEYQKKLEKNKIVAEEQTAKRRRKRQKMKEKKMLAKKSKLEQKSECAAQESDCSPKQQASEEEAEGPSEDEEKDDAEEPSFVMKR